MNNRGISFIELIIIIAILGILGGGSLMYLRLGSGSEAGEAQKKIAYMIENTKITAMGKDASTVEFFRDGENLVAEVVVRSGSNVTTTKEIIAGRKILVFFSEQRNASAANETLLSTQRVKFDFDRSSGALKGASPIQYIRVQKDGIADSSKIIRIYKETGKLDLGES